MFISSPLCSKCHVIEDRAECVLCKTVRRCVWISDVFMKCVYKVCMNEPSMAQWYRALMQTNTPEHDRMIWALSGTGTHTITYIHVYTCMLPLLHIIPYCPGQTPIQLKHQNLRVGGYTEEVLTCKWFNYPRTRAHPGCEVICQGVLRHHFISALSRPARQWRKLYHATKLYRATKLTNS